jgi:sugar lactone lactonase YvrE
MRALLALCAVVAGLLVASPATASTIEPYVFGGFGDGSGSVGAPSPFEFTLGDVGVDAQSGNIYVASTFGETIYKLDSSGSPAPFSALAPATTLSQTVASDLFVDNSGTATQGRIYAFSMGGFSDPVQIGAYEPSGNPVPGFDLQVPGASTGDVAPDGSLWIASWSNGRVYQYDQNTGAPTGASFPTPPAQDLAIDSQGNFYVLEQSSREVRKYDSGGDLVGLFDATAQDPINAYPTLAVDRGNDHVFVDRKSFIVELTPSGTVVQRIGEPEPGYDGLIESQGIAINPHTHTIYASNEAPFPRHVDYFVTTPPVVAPDVETGPPALKGAEATLRATIDPDGVATTDCTFEWGPAAFPYANSVPCDQGDVLEGTGPQQVSASIAGLKMGETYHFRISAKNANSGVKRIGLDRSFVAQAPPEVSEEYASEVNTDGVRIRATIDSGSGPTTFQVEYGTDTGYGTVVPVPALPVLGRRSEPHEVSVQITGLSPGTEYHYRVIATNDAGTTESSEDHSFRTFPFTPVLDDPCENALARQQTGAAHLLECRAYELVSASNTNGYDVESPLVQGGTPFEGYPRASDRLLYSVHDGGIEGTGSPTNHGVDPYLAVRGGNGWTTSYVGIPADTTPSAKPFASTLLGADQGLRTFAFGGPRACSPCFPDGTTGIPVRTANGTLVQGMAGDSADGPRVPDGAVLGPLSANGSHLVFGSAEEIEDGGNSNGDVSIYDRDLLSGETQVVSTDPSGANLACLQGPGDCHAPGNPDGIGELAISADGSRIVVAQRVSTDSRGNDRWHPYMHIGSSPETVDLAPGASSGVLFGGMTADGSHAFYTTADQLVPGDTDSSADVYEAAVDDGEALSLHLVSTTSSGTASNSDSCNPVAEWNAGAAAANCDAISLAGGAGVASGDGTFYFLSPELLDGSEGEADQANLYVVPAGASPRFVAVLDSAVGKAPPPPEHPFLRAQGSATTASFLALDNSSGGGGDGSLYVADTGSNVVRKYDSSGALDSGWGSGGEIDGSTSPNGPFGAINGIAVDGSGNLVVISPTRLFRFAPNGDFLSDVSNEFLESLPRGLAIGPDGSYFQVGGFSPTVEKLDAGGNRIGAVTHDNTSAFAVDASNGDLYALTGEGSKIQHYAFESSNKTVDGCELDFFSGCEPTDVIASPLVHNAVAITVDPATHELYVDMGPEILVLDKTGHFVTRFGDGQLSGSSAVEFSPHTGYVYATDKVGGKVKVFGLQERPVSLDNAAVVHAGAQATVHSYGDFQVTPDGDYAAFGSAVPLTGYDNHGHLEVFRYSLADDQLDCVSCVPTNARATNDSRLAQSGLSLADDGRVFFTSSEALTLRDSDAKDDAYEWSDGRVELISTGISQFASEMLSASADGKDAFFFTRDALAAEDTQNGSLARIYDAREGGGRFVIPEPPPCAAADECHGPGSVAAAAPSIGSLAGTAAESPRKARPCRKKFVRRHGKCVKKRAKKAHHRRRAHR